MASLASHNHFPPNAEEERSRQTRTQALRRLARWVFVLPGLGLAVVDARARRTLIAHWPPANLAYYAATLALGGVLWGGLVAAASARRGWGARLLLTAGAAFAVGGQLYFFDRYHAYMNPRAVLVGTSMLPSVGQQVWSDRVAFLRAVLPPVAFCALIVAACRHAALVSTRGAKMGFDAALAAMLVSAFGAPVPGPGEQTASPDLLYLASLGRLATARWRHDALVERAHPSARTPVPVPNLAVHGDRRSVLLLLTESVRATDACSRFSPDCETTPFTNALLPHRFGFTQMRALDSTTAVSLAVLWSGQPPDASRETLHEAPLLFEYAHAAAFDAAYWTSQNLLFANAGTWLEGLPLSHRITATDLESDPTYELGADDAKLVDAALRDLRAMKGPFLGVVHFSNTHFPYAIDAADAPFQPQSRTLGASDALAVHNRYRNAVHRQDALVARLVRGVRAMPAGDRVAIVFISDHGEQIRERGAIGHTWGVYDEELRVPFWIDLPAGQLSAEQAETLRRRAEDPLTELDLLPTLLDLMGVWDAPALASLRRTMPGESVLRPAGPPPAVVLTNCSAIFTCAFKNWGALRGTRKLLATQSDTQWRCFDVIADPEEKRDLGAEACGDLQNIAEGGGRGTPF